MKGGRLAGSIGAFVLYSFLGGFVPVYPVYMIMLSSWGLDYVQLSLILSIWALPVVILELPSSMLADRWSKRALLVIGMAMKALGYAIWMAFPGFAGACAGFVLWGCQEALCSGSFQALLYERLAESGLEDRYEAAAGICGAATSIATAAAMILGGFAYARNPSIVLILSVAASAGASLAALRFHDAPLRPGASAAEAGAGGFLASLKAPLRMPGFAALIALACATGSVCGTVEEYDGLWYQERFGLPLGLVGIWSTLRFGAEALGGLASGPLKWSLGRLGRAGASAAIAAAGAAFASAALLPGLAGAGPYILYYLAMASLSILIEGRLQSFASDESRATLLSTANLLMTALAMLISPAFGLAAKAWGLSAMILAAGLLTVAAAPIALTAGSMLPKAGSGADAASSRRRPSR